MNTKIIAVIILLIVLGAGVYGYEAISKKSIVESPSALEESNESLPILDIKEQYRDGKFTFAGDVQAPTPCNTVTSEAVLNGDNSYQIQITIKDLPQDAVCADVITDKEYSVTFEASQNAQISATINEKPYELNRFSVPLDQDINTYELHIKG